MCDPATIMLSGLAVGGATGIAGIIGQNEQYQDALANRALQDRFNKERFAELGASTARDVSEQIDTLRTQREQVRVATYNQIRSVADDAKKAMGVTRARNSARGIKGRSAEALVDEFERDFMNFEDLKLTELSERYDQYNLEERAIRNRGQSIINSGFPQPLPSVRGGNLMTPILQGATAGLGVAGSLSQLAQSDVFRGLFDAPQQRGMGLVPTQVNTGGVFSGPPMGANQMAFAPGIRYT